MIVIPAIDLRDGACVQLVGGSYADERVRRDDPLEVAREWIQFGFRRLHLVDLDAATGRGANRAVVREVLREPGATVQAGGGVRDRDRLQELLEDGAECVIVGTRALEEAEWLAETARSHPGRLIVAADVRERRVVTRGWAKTLPLDIRLVVERLNALPLAGLLVTAVHREGQLAGTDLPLMEEVAQASRFPVYASGGITSVDELRALDQRGVAGAVIGMALYTGAMDPRTVAREFA